MKKVLIALFCLTLSFSSALAASAAVPDPSSNPVLANIQKIGAKIYFLGNRAGLDGWLIVKNGQMQIAYATPDNRGALIGALFGQDGDNITEAQINNLAVTNKEVADILASAGQEQNAIAAPGGAPSPLPATPIGALPAVALSPGERLFHDLSVTASVMIGKPMSPEIIMVMDPRCPHCQATWKALHDSIAKGAVHLRMVPIGNQDSDNERAAAILLSQDDPMTAWDKYINGDKSALAGTPAPAALAAVRANHTVIDAWKIESTPYLVYHAVNGKVKILQGEPEKISTLLTDLGQ